MLQSVQFSQPPPPMPNLSIPPPNFPPPQQPPAPQQLQQHRYGADNRLGHRGHFFQPFRPYTRPGPAGPDSEFDGKRLRKSVMRKTVDYNSAIIKMLESRVWQRDFRDRRALQPDVLYYPDLQPPPSYADNPINSVTTRFVKTATNKMRCPIFCMAWTPEGRRLVTGASSGEFTLWNGLTFNFETILQAHDSPVRTMVWSHNDIWMVTGDHAGYVKYWQSNMNNVKMFQAHKEAIRGLSFSPTDHKFVTCSDDGTLRIWDFMRCHEERILRGHGADVKCVHWHPQKGLVVSGSKDNQQPVKLWDPKTGQSLATLHAHKSTVMDIKWNANGNWLVTASRDHLLKLFDLRNLSTEVQTFRGHKKEASSVAWHPYHEGLFCSGGSDGAILFWHVGADKEVGGIEQAHDSIVWTLAWHPLGHILCSGSNDHTSKFWTRNRPGDAMRDKYNLNTLPAGLPGIDDQDVDEPAVIPGMGPEDKVEGSAAGTPSAQTATANAAQIPGLDFEGVEDRQRMLHKKVPYSKPIPRNFQAQWNETGKLNHEEIKDDDSDDEEKWAGRRSDPITEVLSHLIESNPPPGVIPLSQLQPQAILIYGKLIPVEGNQVLTEAIQQGPEALNKLINSGEIEELQDVIPHDEDAPAGRGAGRRGKTDDSHPGDGQLDDEDSRGSENPQDSNESQQQAGTRNRRSRFSDGPVDVAPKSLDMDERILDRDMRTAPPVPYRPMLDRLMPDRLMPDRPMPDRPMPDRPISDRPMSDRPLSDRPMPDRPLSDRPMPDRPLTDRAMPERLLPDRPTSDRPVSDMDMRFLSAPRDVDLRAAGATTGDLDLRRAPLPAPPPMLGPKDSDLRRPMMPPGALDEDLRVPPLAADRYHRDVPPLEMSERDMDLRQPWGTPPGGGPAGPRKRRWEMLDEDMRPATPQGFPPRLYDRERDLDLDLRGRSPPPPAYRGRSPPPPSYYRKAGPGRYDSPPAEDADGDWPPGPPPPYYRHQRDGSPVYRGGGTRGTYRGRGGGRYPARGTGGRGRRGSPAF